MRFIIAVVLAGTVLGCQGNKPSGTSTLANHQDSVSYSIGYNMGRNLSRDSIKISFDALTQGMRDEAADSSAKKLLTSTAVDSVVKAFQSEMIEKQQNMLKTLGFKNQIEGEAFLATNKTKEGVVTLPSGLQYKVITDGTGTMPKASQTVTVNYRGALLDGKPFDSSYERGQPATFPVGGVIPGWTEALQKMKVGSKWQIWIPSRLAYGERGAGGVIPPNSTLVFEVELLSVK